MNLSHAYSDHAPKPKSYLGIGLVVAIHLVGIYALSAGMIHQRARPHEPMIPVPPPVEKTVDPVPQKDPFEVTKPVLHAPVVKDVTPIPWEEAPPSKPEAQPKGEPPIGTTISTAGPGTPVPTTPIKSEPAIRTAGAVCSVMPQPEVPAVSWTGEAVLQVLATVRGGRVVGSDVRVMQGALDGKTRRSLQRSVESALSGYQCQGDATFQQDFAFRID